MEEEGQRAVKLTGNEVWSAVSAVRGVKRCEPHYFLNLGSVLVN
jgi:hypothetical protein